MLNDYVKKNYHILTYFICYLTLLIGFFVGENVTTGPKQDFFHTWDGAMEFNDNWLFSLLNFDKIENYTRISPIYLLIISLINKVFQRIELTKFFLFLIMSFCQILFYKILKKIYFPNTIKNKNILFCLSCVIFISPSFRANIIWPESAMLGLLFFLVGLYYFFRNQLKAENKNIFLNILFVALAAYIRPSFALFSVIFFILFLIQTKNLQIFLCMIIFNLILAFPAFYYLFILEIQFFNVSVAGKEIMGLNLNYLSKLPLVLSIIFFHLIPILYYKKFFIEKFFFKKNFILILLSIFISSILILLFEYDINLSGGGIFLHLSNFFFENDTFFLISIPFFTFFIIKLLLVDFYKNITILSLIVLSIPQYTVYHKYFDPLIIILAFTLINFEIKKDFFHKKFIGVLYIFYFTYYIVSFVNNYYLIV